MENYKSLASTLLLQERVDSLVARSTKKQVTEATLNRLLSHIATNSDGFSILSADRTDRSSDPMVNRHENNKARTALKGMLRDMGIGFIQVFGGWIENKGEPTEKATEEQSFFLPNISREKANELLQVMSEEFNQESILWGRDGTGVFDLNASGKETKLGDKATPTTVAIYYTRIKRPKGHVAPGETDKPDAGKFTFEGLRPGPFSRQLDAIVYYRTLAAIVQRDSDR